MGKTQDERTLAVYYKSCDEIPARQNKQFGERENIGVLAK
jgi:hypothetical protein